MRIIIAAKVNAVSVLRRLEQRSLCHVVCCPIDCFEALNAIIEVWELFDALPAKVRECFGNDPEEMLECLNYEDKYFNNLENPSKSVSLASQILKTETKIRAIMMRIFVQRKRLKLASKKTEDFRKEELA